MSSSLFLFSYAAIVVFIVGLIVRAVKIAKLPLHLRWELAPVPHEKGRSHYGGSYFEEFEWWTKPREKSLFDEVWYMFQEIFFLKGVWEHNRQLWWFSFPLHQGLYWLAATMFLAMAGGIFFLFGIDSIAQPVVSIATVTGWLAFILGSVGAVGLLISRLTVPSIRDFSSVATYFNLVLLGSMFITGLYSIATIDFSMQLSSFWAQLFTFKMAAVSSSALALHLAIVMFFLFFLPFSYMMHFMAKYFMYHEVRWDDKPMEAGSKQEKLVQEYLAQKVTWSAKHIDGQGTKNWVDIATEEIKKDE